MKTERARRLFASLMKLARVRDLSTREKELLSQARQVLRRRSRPAMNPSDLFADSEPLLFEEGKSRPQLGRTEKEALTLAGSGRRPQLLKETRQFDESRLVSSPLFAGRGGKQKLIFGEKEETRQTSRTQRREICPYDNCPMPAGEVEIIDSAHHFAWHQKRGDAKRNPRKPTLSQAVDARLQEMKDTFRSGITETTGRLVHAGGDQAGGRDVVRRLGGAKPAYQELRHESASPQAIAGAIDRGRGKVYERVRRAVEDDLLRQGFKQPRKRSRGRLTVAPHKAIRPYCSHCKQQHARGEHRFHGEGAYHRTHLFSFNPRKAIRRLGPGYEVRYARRIGRLPGDYKHEILSRRAMVYTVEPGWYQVKDRSIIIATRRPTAG